MRIGARRDSQLVFAFDFFPYSADQVGASLLSQMYITECAWDDVTLILPDLFFAIARHRWGSAGDAERMARNIQGMVQEVNCVLTLVTSGSLCCGQVRWPVLRAADASLSKDAVKLRPKEASLLAHDEAAAETISSLSRGLLGKDCTRVMTSAASAETSAGMCRSTRRIRAYVASNKVSVGAALAEQRPTLSATHVLEGRFAAKELVGEDAKGPEVHLLIVRLLIHHLWREVVERSTEGMPPVARRMHAPAEISQLELAINAEQQVLGLDVPVDDVLAVQVGEGIGHLRDVLTALVSFCHRREADSQRTTADLRSLNLPLLLSCL